MTSKPSATPPRPAPPGETSPPSSASPTAHSAAGAEEIEEEEEFAEDYFDGVEDPKTTAPHARPTPPRFIAAIYAGRAEGRQELIELIRQQAVEKKDLRTLLDLLKRMDSMDK